MFLNIGNMSEARDIEDVTLTIHTGKAGYKVGEAIDLAVTLSNSGTKPMNVLKFVMLPADAPGKNNLKIQVHDAGGNLLSRVSDVLTGRALYYPEEQTLAPGETYTSSFRVAGTFARPENRDNQKHALWSLGEDPEICSNEYPPMTPGKFSIQAMYEVGEQQWEGSHKTNDIKSWTGQLVSNTVLVTVE
jgi:hypothetical protein